MKLRYLMPVLLTLGLLVLLGYGLKLDPRVVPSPLIGKPMPDFRLETLEETPQTLTPLQLQGRPTLVNFWASWCAGCQVEHPLLMQLASEGRAQIVGIAYKDVATDSRAWLARHGNPYAVVAMDDAGKTGLDWGVYGVPETFVIDSSGIIVHKQIGPMTVDAWSLIEPMLK